MATSDVRVASVIVGLLACTRVASGAIRFGEPVLMGHAYYVTGFFGFGDGKHAFGPTEDGMVQTNDGGKTWRPLKLDPPFTGPAVLSADGTTIHDLGDITRAGGPNKLSNHSRFSVDNCTKLTVSGGEIVSSTLRKEVTFEGIPSPGASCATEKGMFGCPFRTGGRGYVRLSDGTLVMSIIIYAGGSFANPTHDLTDVSTSVIAFRSTDEGFTWTYSGTILAASSVPKSQEGPNENDLVMLGDGKTIMCIVRLDAGDGPLTHPYVPYYKVKSSDGGFTWTAETLSEGVGCARPRLMGFANGAVVLSGGRLGPMNRDVLVWLDDAGQGDTWEAFSITYWHNALVTNSSLKFTSAVNHSVARESTSYTSLVRTGDQDGFITYGRHLPPGPDLAFVMPFSIIS